MLTRRFANRRGRLLPTKVSDRRNPSELPSTGRVGKQFQTRYPTLGLLRSDRQLNNFKMDWPRFYVVPVDERDFHLIDLHLADRDQTHIALGCSLPSCPGRQRVERPEPHGSSGINPWEIRQAKGCSFMSLPRTLERFRLREQWGPQEREIGGSC